jgi:carbon monoxide dehydrogenase subunit G
MKLSFRIKKPCDFVFEQLSDLQKFVIVHPVISKIETSPENTHLVYETLKLGFLPYSFKYPVIVDCNASEKTICMKATVKQIVKIEIQFLLKSDGEHGEFTQIEEQVIFRSILPVSFIMKQVFRKQHKLLFENIEKLKE